MNQRMRQVEHMHSKLMLFNRQILLDKKALSYWIGMKKELLKPLIKD